MTGIGDDNKLGTKEYFFKIRIKQPARLAEGIYPKTLKTSINIAVQFEEAMRACKGLICKIVHMDKALQWHLNQLVLPRDWRNNYKA